MTHKSWCQIDNSFQLITKQVDFKAGDEIKLEFSGIETVKSPKLYISNSYGSTVYEATSAEGDSTYIFELEEPFNTKTGIVNWNLIHDDSQLKGQLSVSPRSTVTALETYLGPPTVIAGGEDYAMMVIIPTDRLDNPLADGTAVSFQKEFLNDRETDILQSKDLVAYKTIYSTNSDGRILMSTSTQKINSKEYVLDVKPAIPTDFEILADRVHSYADGNQITTFKTSIIRDKQNNTVSDGTYVEFIITNSKGNKLSTSGSTIDGVATAKMIHPDRKATWRVKASITGMGESNVIHLDYEQVITDFDVTFDNNNRTISIGPLKSFMDQMIPDGLAVSLNIESDTKESQQMSSTSIDGYVQFTLNDALFPSGTYDITVSTAGITKSFKSLQL